ncbi:MAG: sigma-70 family RNA polymerase sigma factor [Planctomycetes bacterium]|nr:sigma-70 family RNA polymerase sigma factor [Planctomycetota bacterium]
MAILSEPSSRLGFPSTRWSHIRILRDPSIPEYRQELSAFIGVYWTPVYAWIRAWGRSREEAHDLTQDFFLLLMEHDFISKADAAKGPFRRYLKVLLKHFLIDAQRIAGAKKRGGNLKILSFDFAQETEGSAEPADGVTPEAAFDCEWKACVVREALARLEIRLRSAGKEKHWQALRAFDVEPSGDRPPSYAELAPRLGVRETQLGRLLFEARRECRAVLREVVREYCESDDEIDGEMAELL